MDPISLAASLLMSLFGGGKPEKTNNTKPTKGTELYAMLDEKNKSMTDKVVNSSRDSNPQTLNPSTAPDVSTSSKPASAAKLSGLSGSGAGGNARFSNPSSGAGGG